tara:strand:- start:383 stop:1378 length:996 start_codon:yes stop_codon:yes gene_type:complete
MKILITGSAGFIGFHLTKLLLSQGYEVLGVDNYNNYYDPQLKRQRTKILQQSNQKFNQIEADINDAEKINSFCTEVPDFVVHLAAQAGVRYSLQDPQAYLNANINGTFCIMELARKWKVKHLLMASTSSVYGSNTEMPFDEKQKCDNQISFYAATKKSCEILAHSHAHSYNLPTTMFRFFTVYGPWGRPDMALFKFTHNILAGKPIDIYNNGLMTRDFTYVDDLVKSIFLLLDKQPDINPLGDFDSLSPVAPFRIVNIGNSQPEPLMGYISILERELGQEAIKNYLPMQPGDVQATSSDTKLLKALTGYKPDTKIKHGIHEFVKWYKQYHS